MQPWLMRVGGKKDGKHYRGQREGGISENASYYVFLNQPGRAIGKNGAQKISNKFTLNTGCFLGGHFSYDVIFFTNC